MNVFQIGAYALTGRLFGKLPVKESAIIARKAAEEGIVLLKNNGVLPLLEKDVALFGSGSTDTSVCGTGSGYAFSPYTISVAAGLLKVGLNVTSSLWMEHYHAKKQKVEKNDKSLSFLDKRFSGITPYFEVDVITAEEIESAKKSEVAIYVIRRNTGEGYDRTATKGDYYLSENEKTNIELLSKHFEKVIVVLNTCVVDCKWLQEQDYVSAIVLLGQAGLEAGYALGKILVGEVCPSGRLTDTFALSYDDYPASKSFSQNDSNTLQEDYVEDIYVGYRHFDTKELNVVYPFGYGLSYTSFAFDNVKVEADWKEVKVSLDVTNIGNVSGKEVVQLYVSAPDGKLKKPYQELKAYQKTSNLKPQETQNITLTIATRDLSSYDEETSAWMMEKGNYILRLGKHSRDTKEIGAIALDETVTTVQLSKQLTVDHPLAYLDYPRCDTSGFEGTLYPLYAKDYTTVNEASTISKTLECFSNKDYETKPSKYSFKWNTDEVVSKVRTIHNATLLDVVDGKITLEEFVATLDNEVLVRLVTGAGQETKHYVLSRLPRGAFRSNYNGSSSGKTTDMFSKTLGIPAASFADGPAGIHYMGSPSTSYPVGMVLAQTFNESIIAEVGDMYGREMEHYDTAICLGPGMNIHRDPLCGRNFEYYSEDPLVTGNSAVAFINGLQKNHPGFGVATKHFCCNNQELDRTKSNSTVSERALREIYLKGFEIAVKKAQPATIMSSYNLVNGIHTSSRYDLLTDVLRGEWGFEGFVMTDWDGDSDRIMDLQAGNDIIMGGYDTRVLMAACGSVPTEFNEDGSIKQRTIKLYGGMMKKQVDCLGSFVLDKNGTDTIEAPFKEKAGDRVASYVKDGVAEIDEANKKVIYKGFDRSYSLKRSVLQRNALRILKYDAFGAPMKLAKRK